MMTTTHTTLPDGWIETTLGEVSDFQYGLGESAQETGEYLYIRITDINTDGSLKKSNLVYISQDKVSEKDILKKGDILVARTGASYGKSYIFKEDIKSTFGGFLIRLVLDESKINNYFLFSFMRTYLYWGQANSLVGGGAQPQFNANVICNIKLLLPPLPEQQAIAKILSSFDDKIELLREQNDTLEKMAQTIFEEWFILDKSISKQRLGKLVEVKRGGSPRPIQDYISETGYKWLKISDASATQGPFIFDIKESIIKEGLSKTTLLKAGALVLSNSATPGIPKILAIDSCIHDGWLHFPKSEFSNEFLYLLFQYIRPELIQQGSGSVFTNLKTDILKDYEAPFPSKELLKKFNESIKPIFEKIKINSLEIQTLSKTRDELLPKLMKGEVRVV